MKCRNCGQLEQAHIQRRCPSFPSISIDGETIKRVKQTHHPRLLALVLSDSPRTLLKDVHVEALRLDWGYGPL